MVDNSQISPPVDDGLTFYKRLFDESRLLSQDNRRMLETCHDYYDGKQLTQVERETLRKRGQPEIVINRVRAAVNGVLGVTAATHSEPRAWPKSPNDEDSADVVTDVLRFVADETQFSAIKLQCFKDYNVLGTMAAVIEVDEDFQIEINQVKWEEFFFDVRSRRLDFSDARHLGIAKWRYAEDVKAEYPKFQDNIEQFANGNMTPFDDTFRDRPVYQTWVDKRQRRVLVVEMYHRSVKGWERCVFFGGGVLDKGPSPFVDHKDKPICPIVAQSAYIDRDNNRYGIVVDMLGPQDEINKRRSKLLHHASASQIQAVDPSAIEVDADQARREAARADGVIPFGWQKVKADDMAAGQAALLAEAKGEIERLGPNPAILGRQGADSSGRALLARQQSGMTELAILFDGLNDWELRVYRQVWARCRQFWKDPQYIRVTDDQDAAKFIHINEPIQGPPTVMAHPETGMPYFGRPILGYKNALAEMDVDIKLDTQPDMANIQSEQFRDLVQVVGSNPAYAQSVPFEVMLDLSAIPHKRQIKDQIKKYREEQQQAGAQAAQMQQQIAMATAQAGIQKTQSEAVLNEAKAKAEGVNAFAQIHAAARPESVAGDQ